MRMVYRGTPHLHHKQFTTTFPHFSPCSVVRANGVVAICSAAWALYRVGVPRLPVIVLLGTLLSTYSHALPYGPVGTTCFLLAVLWIELVWRRSPRVENSPAAITSVPASTEVVS